MLVRARELSGDDHDQNEDGDEGGQETGETERLNWLGILSCSSMLRHILGASN